jgi:hypothetical protein
MLVPRARPPRSTNRDRASRTAGAFAQTRH